MPTTQYSADEDDSEQTLLVPKNDKNTYWSRIAQKCTGLELLSRIFPCILWIPKYSLHWLQCDIIAGLTVGLTVIPQGLAYAQIADLPVQYGLYSAFMGGFVYCILGTSKDVTLGPTAIMSLLVHSYGDGDPVQVLILTLLSGCIQFVMGVFHLGFFMWFLSIPVISGFTSAAAITIGFGQLKHVLGVKTNSSSFIPEVIEAFEHLPQANLWDVTLGLCCFTLLLLLRFTNKIRYTQPPTSACQAAARKFLWFISIGRNAVIVICAAALAYAIHTQHLLICETDGCFTLTGNIDQGLPPFKAPKFSEVNGNETISASELMERIGVGFAIVPLMGILESVAIGKAFARKNGYSINVNQEMIAIGTSNILGSFVSSYPITGSFSRTAINAQSGVETPAGGVFTGILVILGLAFLTPTFFYIPKAALAAVIISAVIFMVDTGTVYRLWKSHKVDLIPLFVTFFMCFWEIPYGILGGMAVSLMILLYPVALPQITYDSVLPISGDGEEKETLLFYIKNGLSFPAAEHLCSSTKAAILKSGNVLRIVYDFQHVAAIDYTVAIALCELASDLQKDEIQVLVVSASQDIQECLNSTCDMEVLTFMKDFAAAMRTVAE